MVFAGVEVGLTQSAQNLFPAISSGMELYHRYVRAVNSSVTQDQEQLIDATVSHQHTNTDNLHGFAVPGINGMIGHGPKANGDEIHA